MLNNLRIVLLLSLLLIFTTLTFSQEDSKPKNGNGIGTASGIRTDNPEKTEQKDETATSVRILSKVPSKYTAEARKNAVEGSVRLRVTFLATGEIGAVTPVTNLPYGLTEQAIAAARQLKFIPAIRKGVPINVVKQVDYKFSLYYGENDKELKQNAELLEIPIPEHPQENNLGKIGGKIKLELILNSDGRVEVVKVSSNLPKEFEQKAIEAASKIKFNPAVHKNGNLVTQGKEIEYEFKAQ